MPFSNIVSVTINIEMFLIMSWVLSVQSAGLFLYDIYKMDGMSCAFYYKPRLSKQPLHGWSCDYPNVKRRLYDYQASTVCALFLPRTRGRLWPPNCEINFGYSMFGNVNGTQIRGFLVLYKMTSNLHVTLYYTNCASLYNRRTHNMSKS